MKPPREYLVAFASPAVREAVRDHAKGSTSELLACMDSTVDYFVGRYGAPFSRAGIRVMWQLQGCAVLVEVRLDVSATSHVRFHFAAIRPLTEEQQRELERDPLYHLTGGHEAGQR